MSVRAQLGIFASRTPKQINPPMPFIISSDSVLFCNAVNVIAVFFIEKKKGEKFCDAASEVQVDIMLTLIRPKPPRLRVTERVYFIPSALLFI